MVRDRPGIKPFYFAETRDGVIFGSEPKAILANPLVPREVDIAGLRELLAMAKAPGRALWKHIREVEPGNVVTVGREGVRTRTYWSLPSHRHADDLDTTVSRVGELMEDIGDRHLIADVPRCELLSGGLDSSAFTGLAAKDLGREGEALNSYFVDLVGQVDAFRPDGMRDTPDSPFIREVSQFVGSAHTDVVLDSAQLTDPAVRRAVIAARDIPAGLGDMDTSLYLLFRSIREKSTVALSGESADEIFGGYRWFFDEGARSSDTFPWTAFAGTEMQDRAGILRPEFASSLDIDTYIADEYATAVAAVPTIAGETESDHRMRVICNHHLARCVRMLLDRTKSPYPSTQDVAYAQAFQAQLSEVLSGDGPMLEIVDRDAVARLAKAAPGEISGEARNQMDRALDLYHWFDMYSPELVLG